VCARTHTHTRRVTRTFRGPGRAVAKLFRDPVGKAIAMGVRAITDEPIEVRIAKSKGVEGVGEARDARPPADLAQQADGLRRGLVPPPPGRQFSRTCRRGGGPAGVRTAESSPAVAASPPLRGSAPTASLRIAASRPAASDAMSASLCMRPSASRWSAGILFGVSFLLVLSPSLVLALSYTVAVTAQ